jgi:hypothetical protein
MSGTRETGLPMSTCLKHSSAHSSGEEDKTEELIKIGHLSEFGMFVFPVSIFGCLMFPHVFILSTLTILLPEALQIISAVMSSTQIPGASGPCL